MNKTFHIIKKDLRACAWWLALWTGVCVLHMCLRIHQLGFGDQPPSTAFWRALETSGRWDWIAVRWLPLLVIPLFMHADPVMKRYAFWKSLPISRGRLLLAKVAIIMAFFVILPFLCEFIYASLAGFSPTIGEPLAMWAWRFLPLVAVVSLVCYFTPGIILGFPLSALLCFVLSIGSWTRPSGYESKEGKVAPPLAAQPPGCRIVVDENSVKTVATFRSERDPSTGKDHAREMTSFSLNVAAESLPGGALVGLVACNFRMLEDGSKSVLLDPVAPTGPPLWMDSAIPCQEDGSDDTKGLCDFSRPKLSWNFTGTFDMSARSMPIAGASLKGVATVILVKKIKLHSMDFSHFGRWGTRDQRMSVYPTSGQFSPALTFDTSIHTAMFPETSSFGIRPAETITPEGSIVWLSHKSLPYARLLQRPDFSQQFEDVTRSRSLLVQRWRFEAASQLTPQLAPLAKLRFTEAQSSRENWQLEFVRYEPIGRIEIPFSVMVKRPQTMPALIISDADDDLAKVPPSFEALLKAIEIPDSPTEVETLRAFTALTELCTGFRGNLASHESMIREKLAKLVVFHPEILLDGLKRTADELKAAGGPERYFGQTSGFADYGTDSHLWSSRVEDFSGYWKGVLNALVLASKPEQRDLFLRYHSPRIDLLNAVYLHHWEDFAMPLMRGIAVNRPIPSTWMEFFMKRPSDQSAEVMSRQIGMGALEFHQLIECVESGLLEGPVVANAAWEATVNRAVRLQDIRDAFILAVKYGVQSAPWDLLRLMRSDLLAKDDDARLNRRLLLSMVQALSVHSDCPVGLAEANAWLEDNAYSLSWNPISRIYERAGEAVHAPWFEPAGSVGRWIDIMGIGTLEMKGDDIRMTSRSLPTYTGTTTQERDFVRLMRDVEGDFTAEVTVDMGPTLSQSWSGLERDIFQCAGLMVEAGRHNFLRLHKLYYGAAGGTMLRQEIRRPGSIVGTPLGGREWLPGIPVRLRVCRHGDWFYTAWSQNGGEWNEAAAYNNAGWDSATRVGPYLCNKMVSPIEARFSGFTVRSSSEAPKLPTVGVFQTANVTPTPTGTRLAGWGVVSNPHQSGEFVQKEKKLLLRTAARVGIWAPGEANAPAVLQPVSGDFTYTVAVGAAPEVELSSGVVVLCDPSRKFCYRIGKSKGERTQKSFNQVLWTEGVPAAVNSPIHSIDPTKPLFIKFKRTGVMLMVTLNQAGRGGGFKIDPIFLTGWPQNLEVGVVGLNAGSIENVIEFSDPVLLQGDLPGAP